MKNLLIIVFMVCYVVAFSQVLEITGTGKSFFLQASPEENWIIIQESNGFNIYTEDFQLVDNFNVNTQMPSLFYVYGVGRDFDNDNNIEILYQVYDSNYYSSVYLKDIETGEVQVSYTGNSSSSYYGYTTGYLSGERIFSIQRMQNNDYNASYTYRSGVQSYASDVNIIHELSHLNQNYPNPFNPSTTISFDLATKSTEAAELFIYNLKGQKIRKYSIVNSQSSITWDGKDETGKAMPSGTYLYQLSVDRKAIDSKKMLMLK